VGVNLLEQDKGKNLYDALWKKALGHTLKEEVLEESVADGEMVLVKRKTTKKEVAPDLAAIKLIIDQMKDELDLLSDEELKKEKDRLIALLKE